VSDPSPLLDRAGIEEAFGIVLEEALAVAAEFDLPVGG
jgi:hypothetical protein